MSGTVGLGGTITLDAVYSDGTGTAVAPTGPTIEVIDPSGVTRLAATTPNRNPSTGRYEHDYTVAAGAETGAWVARWTGTVNGVVVSDDDGFTVVAAGALEFDEDLTVPSAATLETLLGRTFTAVEWDQATTLLTMITGEVDEWCDLLPSPTPSTVTNVILGAARRILSNPDGVQQEMLGGYMASYATSGITAPGTLLSDDDLARLRKWRSGGGLQSLQVGSAYTDTALLGELIL